MNGYSMERIQRTLDAFNKIGLTDNGQERLAYTAEEQEVQAVFTRFCEQEGMQVSKDAAGNIIARRAGRNADVPAVAIGSHLDTVRAGGKFDGTAGVAAGLEVVHRLNEQEIMTEHPVEVIAFAAEESARFGTSTIGSKVMANMYEPEKWETLKDKNGIPFPDALRKAGLDFDRLHEAVRSDEELKAFFELHIEQGPELEHANKAIGIVSGIAAPTRFHIEIQGKASHSGATSMDRRKDALAAAARLVTTVEDAARAEKKFGTVGTVGVLNIEPGAMNVVPGFASLQVDIRGTNVKSIQRVVHQLKSNVNSLENERNIDIKLVKLTEETPVLLSDQVQELFKKVCKDAGVEPIILPSGAGHDAMNMAKKWPTGLLFIPCEDGLSHHPDEHANIQDIVVGTDILERAVKESAGVSLKEAR
ncbi:Zn-dependent hydrolase [Bacillus piscicola]|uniref:Zn-dependent hydrolase n=1 Tax=Bacillus piscicola TaxID=1632684 RepID=UPI001F09D95F|nr:Zn-dependent hydrolase [Bacillus piscicola]